MPTRADAASLRRAAAGVVIALALAACSNDGGDDAKGGGGVTTSTAPSSTTTTAPLTDKARAESIVLTEADVGGGFAAAAPGDEELDVRGLMHFEDCAGGTLLATTDESQFAESDLSKDQNTSIVTVVELAPDDASMQRAVERLNSDGYVDCFSRIEKRVSAAVAEVDGGTLSEWTIDKKTVAVAASAADAFAIETVGVVTGGFKATWHRDVVFLRKGRALAALRFFTADSPYPQAEKDRLAALVLERMGSGHS